MKAIRFRERQPDCYDPPMRYKWVIEMAKSLNPYEAGVAGWWIVHNTSSGGHVFRGRIIGFEDRDDALLFFLAHQ